MNRKLMILFIVSAGLVVLSTQISEDPSSASVDAKSAPKATPQKNISSVVIDPSTLVVSKRITKANGHLQIQRQILDGVPVFGGTLVERYDDAGTLRWSDDQRRNLSDLGDRILSADDAIEVANQHAQALQIEPIIYGVGARKNRHAYQIVFAPTVDKKEQMSVIIDAEVGRVLSKRNLVHTAGRARVYPTSPRATPNLIEVNLDSSGPTLGNEQFVSGNCVDNSVCTDVFPSACEIGCIRTNPSEFNPSEIEGVLFVVNDATFAELDDVVKLDRRAAQNIVDGRPFENLDAVDDVSYVAGTAFGKLLSYAYKNGFIENTAIHFCDMTPIAVADENGDYLHIEPSTDGNIDDAFVELNVFHHLNLVDGALRDMGFTGLPDKKVQVITNYRGADEYNDDSFLCDNGAYTGENTLDVVDNAWFAPSQLAGAPALVFGQGEKINWGLDAEIVYHEYGHAVMFTVAPGIGEGFFDDYGFNRTQAGLHEAYADLTAMWLTTDPYFAEYAGLTSDTPALRDWSKTARCPADMTGEEHDDGLVLPSAIWHAREILDVEAKADFDRATYTIWETLGANDGLVSTIGKLKSEFAIARPSQSEAVNDVLDSFITSDCEARVVNAFAERTLVIQGSDLYELAPYGVPQTLQFRIELVSEASQISFFTSLVDPSNPSFQADMTMFLKKGDEPISWFDTVDGTYDNDADFLAPIELTEEGSGTGSFITPLEPGVYHISIANIGGGAYLWETSFSTDGEVGDGKGDEIKTSSDPDMDSGCATRSPASQPIAFILIFGLFLIGTRRRRED